MSDEEMKLEVTGLSIRWAIDANDNGNDYQLQLYRPSSIFHFSGREWRFRCAQTSFRRFSRPLGYNRGFNRWYNQVREVRHIQYISVELQPESLGYLEIWVSQGKMDGGLGPFRTSVRVESGGRGRFASGLTQEKCFTTSRGNRQRVLWQEEKGKIMQAVPGFPGRSKVLQLRVVLRLEDDIPLTESAESQTDYSVPKDFELACMASLSTDFARLMVQGSTPDVVFECEGQSIGVHSTVVCARSPVIAAMLGSDMIEGRSRVVRIRDMDPDIFKDFVRYMYSAQLPELTEELALAFYEVGDQYALLGLSRLCSKYLVEHLSIQNSCDTLVAADAHSDEDFAKKVIAYMIKAAVPHVSKRWSTFCDDHPKLAEKVLGRGCEVPNK